MRFFKDIADRDSSDMWRAPVFFFAFLFILITMLCVPDHPLNNITRSCNRCKSPRVSLILSEWKANAITNAVEERPLQALCLGPLPWPSPKNHFQGVRIPLHPFLPGKNSLQASISFKINVWRLFNSQSNPLSGLPEKDIPDEFGI